jgi:hypothetical protein
VPNGSRVINTRLGCFESQVLWSWSPHYKSSVEGGKVSALKIVALLLIAAGIVGLVYGGITYTKTAHNARVGPFELSIKDKKTVNIPVWAGVGAIVVGGFLLVVRTKA